MEGSRISLTSAIAVALTLCFSTLCLSCGTHRGGMVTIPAGPSLVHISGASEGNHRFKAPGTPASHIIPQPGKVQPR